MRPLIDRFWEKVDQSQLSPGGCWLWTGSTSGGYGEIKFHGKLIKAHRVSYELEFGIILNTVGDHHGTCVLHRCDVRECVNPAHLFLGSNQDNVIDKVNKGRQSRTVGENSGTSKLKQLDVDEIRRLYKDGTATQTELSNSYGVSQAQISYIVNKKHWRVSL